MCSGIRVICQDGNVLVARTLEFAMILEYIIFKNDKGKGILGHLPGQNDHYVIDGVNHHGITVMAFYFSGYDEYASKPNKNHTNLPSLDVSGYLFDNATSIDHIYELARTLTVLDTPYEPVGHVFPLHWFCVDKKGRSIVIECVNGVTTVYENPYGIMTNDPTFPEHVRSIEADNVQQLTPKPYTKNGTGMIGLPGDFTSVSRFIRLYTLQRYHTTPKDTKEGVRTIFHILNNFDIVKGVEFARLESDVYHSIFTQYTVAYDSHDHLWYKTYDDIQIPELKHESNR